MKARICPKCGRVNLADAWYCAGESCGETLGVDTIADVAEPLAPDLAKLLQADLAARGETKAGSSSAAGPVGAAGDAVDRSPAAPRAERDTALETDEKIRARLSAAESKTRRALLIVTALVGVGLLASVALALALDETFLLFCGLFPALVAGAVVGAFFFLANRTTNQQKRERARLAAFMETQADTPAQDLTLPLRVPVHGHPPIPEVLGALRAVPFQAADFVEAVTVSVGEMLLEIPPRKAAAVSRRLLRLSVVGTILDAGLDEMHKQGRLAIPVADIARVHVAFEGAAAVWHLLYQPGPKEPVRVYSFRLANLSDFGRFWAALKSQVPAENLILPKASTWQARP